LEDGIAKGVECWLSGKAIGKGVELAGSALKKAPGEVAPRATTAAERAAEARTSLSRQAHQSTKAKQTVGGMPEKSPVASETTQKVIKQQNQIIDKTVEQLERKAAQGEKVGDGGQKFKPAQAAVGKTTAKEATQLKWAPEVEEVLQHNSQFKVKATDGGGRIVVEYLEDKIPHILRDAEGHLPYTLANKQLLLDVASEGKNYFAKPDQFGNIWCEKILSDGKQLWVSLRNGQIRNGGLNLIPIKWNPITGLAQLKKTK